MISPNKIDEIHDEHKNYSTELPCLKCNRHTENGNCFHHIKTRGSGGTDQAHNMMPLCFFCHTEVHQIGMTRFARWNYKVHDWLVKYEWLLSPDNRKWQHFKEGEENA